MPQDVEMKDLSASSKTVDRNGKTNGGGNFFQKNWIKILIVVLMLVGILVSIFVIIPKETHLSVTESTLSLVGIVFAAGGFFWTIFSHFHAGE